MDLLNDDVKKLYRGYLFPALSGAVVTSIYSLVDAVAVGQSEGPIGAAAMAVINPFWGFIMFIGMIFGLGGSIMMSNLRGQGEDRDANNYFTVSAGLLCAAIVVIWILLVLNKTAVFYFLGASDTTIDKVLEYGNVMIAGFPFFFISPYMACFVRNDNDPKRAMAAVIAGGAFNVFGDWFLVFPMGLGMFGAALATLLGTAIQSFVLLSHFFTKSNRLRLAKPLNVKHCTKRILSIGIGASLVDLANAVLFTLMNNQINRYSTDDAMSVFGVMVNVDSLFQSLFAGVGQAIQPIVATNSGAGQELRCRSTRNLGLITTAVMGVLFTAICLVFPRQITSLFMDATPEVLTIAPGIMRKFFPLLLFMGTNLVAIYYLQSVLQSGKALIISLGRGLVVSGLLACVLPLLIGETGLWLALPLAEGIIFVVSVALLLFQQSSAQKL